MIAIVVTGLGQSRALTQAALKLPENTSLSFSPYAKDVATWATSARAIGHEVLLDLPLEPTNYPASDPGPYGLLTSKSMGENVPRLHWVLSRMQGYIGITTAPNESYTTRDEYLRPTLELLATRGLLLTLPHEPVRKETRALLDESKIAYMLADMVIDEELNETGIQTRLSALEKIAAKRGYAIGYAQAIPLSIKQLDAWMATMDERGYTLVPLSYVTALKFKK
ncbi:MAG: divergent polysaccharide deacetylase family protein [Proteobacteria bacterium]|nr:divergent polysaccharide deacetylase family protein [Pseudomonadota bacterium]